MLGTYVDDAKCLLSPGTIAYRLIQLLHFTALSYNDIHIRNISPTPAGLRLLYLLDDLHAIDNLAEDYVLAVEVGGRHRSDKELRPIGVGAGVLMRD